MSAQSDANKDMREDVNDRLQHEFKEMMQRIETGDGLALDRSRKVKYFEKLIGQATDHEISDELQRQLDELTSQEPSPEEVDAEYALRPYEHVTSFEDDGSVATWHIEYADPYSDAWNADIVNEYMHHVLHEMIGKIIMAMDQYAATREGETKWGPFGGFYTGDGYIWTGRFTSGILVNLADKEDEGFLDIQVDRDGKKSSFYQLAVMRVVKILTEYKLNVETTTDEQNNE